jgi:hypothetical protein
LLVGRYHAKRNKKKTRLELSGDFFVIQAE